MKHKRIVIISVLVLILGMLAFLIYPKLLLVKAIINFTELESVHIEGTFKLSNEQYEIDLKGNANFSNSIFHADLSTDYIWNPIHAELYMNKDKSDVKSYLSTNLSNNWVFHKRKLSNQDLKISKKDIDFEKVKSDRKGEKKFRIEISGETLASLLPHSSNKITLYLYLKGDKISGIQTYDKIILSEEENLYVSNIYLTFSSWNTISSITIPEDIEKNSKAIDKNVLETLFS